MVRFFMQRRWCLGSLFFLHAMAVLFFIIFCADDLQQDAVEYSDASQSSADLTDNKESAQEDDDGIADSRKRPKTQGST